MLSDYPESNNLLDEKEFSDNEINLAFKAAVSEYNSTPPVHIKITEPFRDELKELLLLGTLAKMYRAKALYQFRNQLNYTDGGGQIATHDKGAAYDGLASRYQQEFMQKVTGYKINLNYEDGYGSISSDYANLPIR